MGIDYVVIIPISILFGDQYGSQWVIIVCSCVKYIVVLPSCLCLCVLLHFRSFMTVCNYHFWLSLGVSLYS